MIKHSKRSVGLLQALTLAIAAVNVTAESNIYFTGKEIFPIDPRIGLMNSADLDQDGLVDLLIVNNDRARINLLYNQSDRLDSEQDVREILSEWEPDGVNSLPPDARFRIESLSSEKRIASLVVSDLNHDGIPDIAYYGAPKELVAQFNLGEDGWSAPQLFEIEDGLLSPNALVAGDLNSDGRQDLALLGESAIYLIYQSADGKLQEAKKIPSSEGASSIQALDLNLDGRQDLFLVDWDSSFPFRFRIQDSSGGIGPELFFESLPIRSYWASQFKQGNQAAELVMIARNSGRAQYSRFEKSKSPEVDENLSLGDFAVTPLTPTNKSVRGALWTDLNNDCRTDLIVADPDGGQVECYFQDEKGSISTPSVFATLTGVTHLAAMDWDGDGKENLFLLSEDEGQIGITSMNEDGLLSFPTFLPLEGGRPVSLARKAIRVGDVSGAAAILQKEETDDDDNYVVYKTLKIFFANGKHYELRLSEQFQATPEELISHDVDQDGLQDLVALIPYEDIRILRQKADGVFEEITVPSPVGALQRPWASVADLNQDGKDELILGRKNFVRSLVLKNGNVDKEGTASWSFQALEQVNGSDSRSSITAAGYLPGPDGGKLFLLDSGFKTVSICGRDESGKWNILSNYKLAKTEFDRMEPVQFGGGSEGANAFSLMSLNSIAWITFSDERWELKDLSAYETQTREGFLMDVVSGDLTGDQSEDLVFLETSKNHLEVVTVNEENELALNVKWKVFEERSFRGLQSGPEPREARVVDVTGDGLNDLLILVHDRIILYPRAPIQ